MKAGQVLSPFDAGWRSGIDWAEMSRADLERERNSEIARTRRTSVEANAYLRREPTFNTSTIHRRMQTSPGVGRTDALRALIAEKPRTCSELGKLIGIPGKSVGGYLRADKDAGRIVLCPFTRCYSFAKAAE